MTEQGVEGVKKAVKIQKFMLEEQRKLAASAQESADKEYQKLKQMEKDLLELIDKQIRLEKEQENK